MILDFHIRSIGPNFGCRSKGVVLLAVLVQAYIYPNKPELWIHIQILRFPKKFYMDPD
jgi:hypothetical protein